MLLNNKKCFLSSKSVYQNDFWRCDIEYRRNDAENDFDQINKCHFTIYWNTKLVLHYIVIIFHNITVLLYFCSNHFSLLLIKINLNNFINHKMTNVLIILAISGSHKYKTFMFFRKFCSLYLGLLICQKAHYKSYLCLLIVFHFSLDMFW